MLQPALNRPALNPPALNSPAPATADGTAPGPATYGTLMAAASNAFDHAIAISTARQPSVESAHGELLGYERFLYTAGNHMLLLMQLAELHTDALRRLTSRLARAGFPDASDGAWSHTATLVGTAHDLLATHLIDGVPRTPEAEHRLIGPNAAAACRRVTEMILEGVDGSRTLMHRAALAQQRREPKRIPSTTFARIRSTNQVIALCARATMWDLVQIPQQASHELETLDVALPSDIARATTFPVNTALDALRLLGQLCHDQARGLTSASPASLRDLAVLGTRVNNSDLLDDSPGDSPDDSPDDRPLARLQRAHAHDQIDAARAAWSAAAAELTTTVQGITKAPGAYGTAVQTLSRERLDRRTRTTLATALPSLGRDAARTVETLAGNGDLVTLQPIPLQPRNTWRPITVEHSDAIASRFRTAADASARATAAIRDANHQNSRQRQPSGPQPQRQTVHLEQALGVER